MKNHELQAFIRKLVPAIKTRLDAKITVFSSVEEIINEVNTAPVKPGKSETKVKVKPAAVGKINPPNRSKY